MLFYLVKKYKKQKKMTRKLANELRKHKALIRANKDDIALMGQAWKLQPDEVEMIEKLAGGAYGEVYKGSLHKTWVCAIKVMKSQDMFGGSRSRSAASKSKKSLSKKKKSMQNSILLRNDEVRFLQRTRNHRLVMFLGMGLTESGDTFIVLEYVVFPNVV